MEQKTMDLKDHRFAKKYITKINQLEEKKKRLDKTSGHFSIGTLPGCKRIDLVTTAKEELK